MKPIDLFSLWLGIILSAFGILLAVLWYQPHFYSALSIGLTIVFYYVYRTLNARPLFNGWGLKQFSVYVLVILAICITIDTLGIKLGYWYFPSYHSLLDTFLKFAFEYFMALQYSMMLFLVAMKYLIRRNFNNSLALFLAIITVCLFGFFIEFLNHCAHSWVITAMPITNFHLGSYYIIFQTFGYLLITFIPLAIYSLVSSKGNLNKLEKQQDFIFKKP